LSAGGIQEFETGIKVAGRAVEYWGSQSISSDASALFELVKNSRDADATRVEITFENVGKTAGRIMIKDNGRGMTKNDVLEKWLVAGTDDKILHTKSKDGRRVWGEMGIGRFSCERLAKKTRMISSPSDKNEKIVMDFDWEKYKKPGITFDQVRHKGFVGKKKNEGERGLELILEGLKAKWTEKKIQDVKNELGTFILPKEMKGPADFEIVINAADYDLKDEQVGDMVTKIAPLRMKAEFDGKETSIKISDYEIDGGQWQTMDSKDYSGQEDIPTCGPLNFELNLYPLDAGGDTKMTNYYEKKLKNLDIKDFLREYSGIYLYRDGAWLKPLGKDNDWLGLEAGRVQRRSKMGLSRVYGIVRINQNQNPGIKPTAHRETLQDNDALRSMKRVLIEAINLMEKYRDDHKPEKTRSSSAPQPEEMAGNNIDEITKILRKKKDGEFTKADVVKLFASAKATKRYIEDSVKERDEEMEKFGELRQHEDTVFTIGLLTSYVAHEVVKPIDDNVGVLREVDQMMKNTDFSKTVPADIVKKGFGWLEKLGYNTTKIKHFISFVNVLSEHIATSVSREGKSYQVKIEEIWRTIADGFKNMTDDLEIGLTDDIHPRELKVKTNRIDLESVLANLFLNAIEILKKKKEGRRAIKFEANYTKEGLVLKFSDNGSGIKPKDIDKIFEPFFTVGPKLPDTAHGQGLGLSIVKKILARHNGTIEVKSPGDYRAGATFTIRIPSTNAKKVI